MRGTHAPPPTDDGTHAHRDKIASHPRDQEKLDPVHEKATKFHNVENQDDAMVHLARSCAVEFIGTFFLCLTVALNAGNEMAALSIGFILMVMVYAGGKRLPFSCKLVSLILYIFFFTEKCHFDVNDLAWRVEMRHLRLPSPTYIKFKMPFLKSPFFI